MFRKASRRSGHHKQKRDVGVPACFDEGLGSQASGLRVSGGRLGGFIGSYRGYIGIMESKMETTIDGPGFRV